MRRAGIAAWSLIGIFIVAIAAAWVLFKIRIIFPPLILAILIIYLLNPIVSRLERRRVSRVWGTILAYVVVLGSTFVLITAITPFVSRQLQSFSDDWPEFKVQIVAAADDASNWFADRTGARIDTSQLHCLLDVAGENAPTAERCDQVTHDIRDRFVGSIGRLTALGSSVLEVVFLFILGPLLALYLLIDLPQLQRDVLNLVPASHRSEVADLGSKIGSTVGGFFRGQLFVALVVGLLSSLGFALIGLKFWLVIGAIAGFTNLIPLVGPFIGGGLGFFVGAVTDGIGTGVKAAIVAAIVQQIDNHIISPNVMKRTVQLHPVTVMLSLLAGGTVAGFWGVLLAVPGVAVFKLVMSHIWVTRVLHEQPTPATEPIVGERPPAEDAAEKPTPSDPDQTADR